MILSLLDKLVLLLQFDKLLLLLEFALPVNDISIYVWFNWRWLFNSIECYSRYLFDEELFNKFWMNWHTYYVDGIFWIITLFLTLSNASIVWFVYFNEKLLFCRIFEYSYGLKFEMKMFLFLSIFTSTSYFFLLRVCIRQLMGFWVALSKMKLKLVFCAMSISPKSLLVILAPL